MAWAKFKIGIITAVIVAGAVGTSVVMQQRSPSDAIANATKDHPYTNSLGMKFIPVPGTEVLFSIWDARVKDFEAFVKETGYDATAGMYSITPDGWKKPGDSWWKQIGDSWRSPGFPQTPDHPVCGVSWNDAQEFCKWLSKKEGKTHRLPMDKEWSYAVGIGDHESDGTPKEKDGKLPGVYPWGGSMPPMVDGKPTGNYGGKEAKDENWPSAWGTLPGHRDVFARTSPVGSFPANELGLYDMGGNLEQWCEDAIEPGSVERVMRGGCWGNWAMWGVLSSHRGWQKPNWRNATYGFRVVLADKLPN